MGGGGWGASAWAWPIEAIEAIKAVKAVEATEVIEAPEVLRPRKSLLRTSGLSRHLNSA